MDPVGAYSKVFGEIQKANLIEEKGNYITINNMPKLVEVVKTETGVKDKNSAISGLATQLIEKAKETQGNEQFGKLATGISNMSDAKALPYMTLVNLKIAGKRMRKIEVNPWETFKSYLSAALIKLGFRGKTAAAVETATTPAEAQEIVNKDDQGPPQLQETLGTAISTQGIGALQQTVVFAETPLASGTKEVEKKDEEKHEGATQPGRWGEYNFTKAIWDCEMRSILEKGMLPKGRFEGVAQSSQLGEVPAGYGQGDKAEIGYIVDLIVEGMQDVKKNEEALNFLCNLFKADLQKLSKEDKQYIAYYIARTDDTSDWKAVVEGMLTSFESMDENIKRILGGMFAVVPEKNILQNLQALFSK